MTLRLNVPIGFRQVAGVALIAVALVAVGHAHIASAESTSTRVILSYVPVVSNWGPVEANGVVVYALAEGDVRADLVGLPVLGDDERYELWLGNSTSGEQYPLTRFNASSSGTTFVDALLSAAIPDTGWDEVRVTVEPEPDADPAPSAKLAIVGGVPGTVAETLQFPPVMPETGERGAVSATDVSPQQAIAAGTVGLGLMVSGLALARERRRMVRATSTPDTTATSTMEGS